MYNIYSYGKHNKWRYSLGKTGSRILYIIGLNPSTATQEKSDTTVAKVERVASTNGFDGFIMLNLYPVRATDYNSLPVEADHEAFSSNLNQIEQTISSTSNPVIWTAWGNAITSRSYFLAARDELIERLSKLNPLWKHFGPLTKAGHSRHPSRLKYSWAFYELNTIKHIEKEKY